MSKYAKILYKVKFDNPQDFSSFAENTVPKLFSIVSVLYQEAVGESIEFWRLHDEEQTPIDLSIEFIRQLQHCALNEGRGSEPEDFVHEIELFADNKEFPVKFIWARQNYSHATLMHMSLVLPARKNCANRLTKAWLDKNVLNNSNFMRQVNVEALPRLDLAAEGLKYFIIYRRNNLVGEFKNGVKSNIEEEEGALNGDYMLPPCM